MKKVLILCLLLFSFQGKTLVISPGLGGTLSLGGSSSGSHVYEMGFGATGEIQISYPIFDNYSLGALYGYSFSFAAMNAVDIIHSAILFGYKTNIFLIQKISAGYGLGSSFDYKGAAEPYTKGSGPVFMISNDIGTSTTLNVQFHMISFPEDKLVTTSTPTNNQIIITFNRNYKIF